MKKLLELGTLAARLPGVDDQPARARHRTGLVTDIVNVFFLVGLLALCRGSLAIAEPVQQITLGNGAVSLQVTPDIGGRVLGVSLTDRQNLLRVGTEELARGVPEVKADDRAYSYFGHIVWNGPQSDWWKFQTVNPQRRAQKAQWPPDPFNVLARNEIVAHTAESLVLQSPPSALTGLAMRKVFRLPAKHKNSVELMVDAQNAQPEGSVAWDLWFNTRVSAASKVLVPVGSEQQVRVQQPFYPKQQDPIAYTVAEGTLVLNQLAATAPSRKRVGKLFITPDAPWMASFSQGQVLLIQYPSVPPADIHPEHSLVELYMDFDGDDFAAGLIEMEVHSAYRELAPGTTLTSRERWTVLPYTGQMTSAAMRAFVDAALQTLPAL
ncbi:DUF4380 domain-containing protein [Teredinibacter turnerae]|uniref:DUF4380 domain-containing protein n=1 Tax=Teredinibacter turnerae TaxID=2426 RepID=UPI0030CEF618